MTLLATSTRRLDGKGLRSRACLSSRAWSAISPMGHDFVASTPVANQKPQEVASST